MNPTLKDVAKVSGVSTATVSLVVNNNPRISEATRKHVLETMRKMNYQPNVHARGLSSGGSHILAILVPDMKNIIGDPYFGEIISGIYEESSRLGYKILLEMANKKFIEERGYLSLFQQKFIDGMLTIGSSLHDTFLVDFLHEDFPLILVNSYFKDLSLNYIVSDYYQAGLDGTEYLLKQGHRHIGFISGSTDIRTSLDLFEGYREALKRRMVPYERSLFEIGNFNEIEGGAACEILLDKNPDMTAVFCGNDRMALGALNNLHALDKKVPEEIAVLGIDDIRQASFVSPALTTYHQPLYRIGKQACQAVVNQIEKRQVNPVRIKEKMTLIERETVLKINSSKIRNQENA